MKSKFTQILIFQHFCVGFHSDVSTRFSVITDICVCSLHIHSHMYLYKLIRNSGWSLQLSKYVVQLLYISSFYSHHGS